MRTLMLCIVCGVMALYGSAPVRGAANQAPRRNIMILATGGTIAGQGTGGAGYTAGQLKVEDLVAAVPGIEKLANLKGEQIANIGSQDMNDKVWLALAQRANQLLSRQDVDGIVVTHGTDTMEETAYFLNLVVKSEKPVVIVGSMRPATAVSADGPGNLLDAVAVAVDPRARGRGVLVVMNDTVYNARDVVKMNTTSLQTFEAPDRGPEGKVVEGEKVTWFEPTDKKHGRDTEFSVANRTTLPRVEIIYAHSNMDGSLIEDAIRDGARGIVIAGVGDGNMTKQALDAVTKAAKQGIVVVRSTRLPTGAVLRNAEVKDDELGLVASGELNPGKSRVLLQLALTTPNHSAGDVQRMFREY